MTVRSFGSLRGNPNGDKVFTANGSLSLVAREPNTVPLIATSYITRSVPQPVTVGIPWPRGVLAERSALCLFGPLGQRIPIQTIALAHWSDRSVKWLLVDFVLDNVAQGCSGLALEIRDVDPTREVGPNRPICVNDAEGGIIVETGAASFILDRVWMAPIRQVEIDGVTILDTERTQSVLTFERGQSVRPRIERFEIEAHGPVRATVRFDGTFSHRRRDSIRFCARLSLFAGLSLVRADLTLHNPRRAQHRGGLWDLGDPNSAYLRDLSLSLGLNGSVSPAIEWVGEHTGLPHATAGGAFEIYQDSSGGENWQSRNHVNRFGEIPCWFRGYRVCQNGEYTFGLRANPVVSCHGREGTVTAAIAEFWQQFPKAIDTKGGTLNLRLFPGQFGDLFELQGGEQKTHSVWFHFSRSADPGVESLKWVHQPARVGCAGVVRKDRGDPLSLTCRV